MDFLKWHLYSSGEFFMSWIVAELCHSPSAQRRQPDFCCFWSPEVQDLFIHMNVSKTDQCLRQAKVERKQECRGNHVC